MDTSNVHNVQTLAYLQQHCPLPNVPAPAFSLIKDLLNLCPDLEMLISWIGTVHHHKQTATHDLLPGGLPRPASRRFRSSKTSFQPAPSTPKGRYKCYKCHTRVGTSKEFRRHMEEKCELLRQYHCPDPDCDKTYRRAYHLSYHHQKHHKCTQDRCIHLIDAAQDEPPKSVLGCGYCIQWFDKAKTFINHLVEHLKATGDEPTWNDTTHVQSLLQHPRFQTTWNSLCITRFNGPEYYWPQLTWDIDDVEEEVHHLQYGINGQELLFCLAKLLEKGIRVEHVNQAPGSLTTSVSLPSYESQEITTTHDVFKDPMLPFTPVLVTNMTNDLPNGRGDFADFANTSPSTLVNTEDFWAANAPPSGVYADGLDGIPFMVSDLKNPLSSSDASLDCTTDMMDLVSWEDNTYDETTHAKMHQGDSTLTSTVSPGTQVDNVEQTVMNTIPRFYSNEDSANKYNTAAFTGLSAPMDIISSPSLEDRQIGSLASGPLPPFNPTPPLQGCRSHKRSISGRFLRMIQNMPNIPPTY